MNVQFHRDGLYVYATLMLKPGERFDAPWNVKHTVISAGDVEIDGTRHEGLSFSDQMAPRVVAAAHSTVLFVLPHELFRKSEKTFLGPMSVPLPYEGTEDIDQAYRAVE